MAGAAQEKSFLSNILKTVSNLWRVVYPPLPEITERNKMVVVDFFLRLFVFFPVQLLSVVGSKYQLMWLRLFHNGLLRVFDKGVGVDGDLKVTETTFSGVQVRIYEPTNPKGNGAIIFIHGGGFVMCSVRSHDKLARITAMKSGLVLISIEYRLAPEHKYPAAVHDCERVAVHFLTEAYKDYSVDPHKVVLMGDSAGGNLAAVTVQRLRQMDVPQPKLQVLIYPWTQILDFKLPSYQVEKRCEGTSILSPSLMARFTLHYVIGPDIGHYINDLLDNKHTTPELRHSPSFDHLNRNRLPQAYCDGEYASHKQYDRSQPNAVNSELYSRIQPYLLDPNVSPLLYPDLDGSPTSMVLTVDIDPLRDDGILFAERLRNAGVSVLHKHYPTGFHAMAGGPLELGQQMVEDIVTFIQENL